jgi:hypothetical protein
MVGPAKGRRRTAVRLARTTESVDPDRKGKERKGKRERKREEHTTDVK